MPTIFEKVPDIVKIITALATVVGFAFAIEAHYATAADVADIKKETTRAIQQQGYDSQISINQLRKQQLEDKIFEIRLIPDSKRTAVDNARLDKYEKDLREVSRSNDGLTRSRNLVQ